MRTCHFDLTDAHCFVFALCIFDSQKTIRQRRCFYHHSRRLPTVSESLCIAARVLSAFRWGAKRRRTGVLHNQDVVPTKMWRPSATDYQDLQNKPRFSFSPPCFVTRALRRPQISQSFPSRLRHMLENPAPRMSQPAATTTVCNCLQPSRNSRRNSQTPQRVLRSAMMQRVLMKRVICHVIDDEMSEQQHHSYKQVISKRKERQQFYNLPNLGNNSMG